MYIFFAFPNKDTYSYFFLFNKSSLHYIRHLLINVTKFIFELKYLIFNNGLRAANLSITSFSSISIFYLKATIISKPSNR